MNKIYRLVWNKYLGLWTVVSELARGTTKKRNVSVTSTVAARSLPPLNSNLLYTQSLFKPILLATVMSSIFYSSQAFAGYELNGGSTFTNCTSASTGSGTESTNSLAFGPNACAPTNDSIAIGRAASTQSVGGVSNQSISIGAFSRAGGDQSVALGANTRATGNSSVAIGGDDVDRLANDAALRAKYNQITGGTIVAGQYPTTTAMQGSTAVGVQANATGDFSSAYGMTSKATGDASAAFGVQANATGLGAVAFGAVAQATGNGSAALGVNATASANNATAIGSGNSKAVAARATAVGATAVGNLSLASGVGAAAIGRNTRASGDRSIALGDGSQSTANGTAAFGVNANASADKAIAIGSGETPDTAAKASAVDATAIGNRSVSSGVGSAAIGRAAQATGDKSLALGDAAQAVTSGDMAVGDTAYARSGAGNISAIALGRNSKADGNNTLAIGNAAQATDNFAAAIGNSAEASADNSIAVGNSAKAAGNFSSALGNTATASGLEASAVGNSATASGDYALATGSRAQATAEETVAIGHAATAQGSGDIAIGSDAKTALGNSNNIAVGNKVTTGATGQNVALGSSGTTANSESAEGGAVAIGRDQVANGDGAVAIGDPNRASGSGAVALGKDNTAAGDTGATTLASGAVAIGNTNQAIGQGSVAIGNTSNAAAAGAIALGDTAVANGGQSVSIGSNSQAVRAGDIAVGAGAYAAAKVVNGVPESAAAFGLQARADGATTLAVGNSAQATADYAGALGNAAEATSIEATAVGNRAQATNEYSTAVGTNATASGLQSTATGNRARATGDFSIAQGNNTEASGLYSTSVGNFSKATGESAVAIGDLANATEADTIAIGTRTAASGQNSNAIGIDAKATGSAAVAMGAGTEASGNNALATGVGANAAAASAVALGDNAQAQSANDIAIGRTAATQSGTGGDNIAIGNAVTTGAIGQNVAIGSDGTTANSRTADGGAVSIGRRQSARGDGAVAIGDPNIANGDGAVALGRNNTAAGDNTGDTSANGAVALGDENQAIGQGSVALGNTSTAAAAGAIALGDTANAQAERGVALGSGATATNVDDVALGSGSVTSAANSTANGTVGGVTYNYAGTTPSSVVSVGSEGNERQITNVAAGRVSETSTDAINGSQLYSTQQALGNLADSTANHLGGGSTVNPDGSITAPSYIVNETPINNVGAAIEALDQGWNLQSNGAGADAIKAGDTVDIGTVAGEENLTVTKAGNTIQYGLNRNLKVDSVTAGDTFINTDGMTITNGPSITKSGINAAGNPMTNVGAGVADTDAVNKSQLDAATAAGKNTVSEGKNITVTESSNADGSTNYQVATADNVEFNNVAVGDVTIDGKTGKISGVTAGDVSATSTDAINGSQLAGTAKSVSDALGGGSTVNPDGTVSAPSYTVNGNNVSNVGAAISELDKGWNLQSNGAKAGAVKAGDTVDIGTVNGEENLTVTKDGNTIQYGLNKNLRVDSVRAGDTLLNDNGVTITNGPSITKSGINAAGNPISNVGAGVNDTDAVNKGQLDDAAAAAKTEVTQGKNITVSKTTGANGQDIYNVATADNVEFNNVTVGDVTIDGTTGKISGVTAGEVSATSDEAINGSQLAGTAKSVSDALGGGSVVNPDGTVTAPSYEVNGETVRNVGDAIEQLDQGWNLQSNGANAGAVKAGDTVDIGTVNGEENLTVSKDGNTIQYGLNKNLRVDSVRAGDTLLNDNGVTITNGPSITKSGINAAGNPISNVGVGVNDSDAVNKGQLDDAAAAAKTGVTQGKNITVSKTTGADGQDIYNVATADNVEFNNVAVGDVTIDATTGKISGVTAGDVSATSTEAINGSQLAGTAKSVSDALGGGSVVNPDGTVTAPSYEVNGETVRNVGDAIEQLDQGWNLQSNGAKAGAVKAGDTVDIGTVNGEENLTVSKDGNTIQYGLNRNLKVDSVTAGDTVINTDGVTISNGPSITKSGINAAGNPISNVGAGVNDSDAVNKGQLDDVAAAAKTEVTQGKNITVSKTTGANGQDIYNVATADNVEFNNVQVGDVTIDGSTGKISGVTAGDVNATSTDAINGSQLAGTAKSVSDALGGGSTVNPDGTVTAPSYEVNGETVRNVGDAIEQLDQGWNLQSNGAKAGAVKAGDTVDIGTVNGEENLTVTKDGNTIQYGLNKDLKVDRVTAGDTVINTDGVTISNGPSITKSGINAAGNKITNVAPGTAGTDVVNKSQLDATTAASKNTVSEGKNITITESSNADGSTNYEVATADNVDFNNVTVGGPNGINIDGTTGKISGVADGSVAAGSNDAVNGGQLNDSVVSTGDILGGGVTNEGGKLNGPFTVSGKGYDTVADAIQGEAAASKTEVTEGKNVTVTKTTGADGQDIYNVATKDDVSFDSVQVGDVNIDGATGKISGVTDGTVAAGSTDAINGNQLAGTAKSVSDALGGGSTVNPDGTVTAPSYTVNGNNVTNVGAAISELDKGWNLQSNGANAGAIKAGDTVDIGTVNGEENLTVSKDGKTIQYSLNKDLKVDRVTAGDTVINTDGVTIANGPSITKSGINAAGNPISNVGAGVDDTDAVNKGQLDKAAVASKTEVTEGKNVTVTKATGADGQDIYNVATKDDVSFDSVQVGDVNIDAATGKISGVADGTIAAGSKDAVNGGQLNDSVASTGDILGGGVTNEGGKLNGPFTVSGKGYDTVADAIQGEAAAAKTEVTEGKNVTVTKTTGADGQDIYKVATKDDVSFDSVQVGDVNIDGATGKISGVADGTVAAGSKEAINGGQIHAIADSVKNSIGGETVLNPNGSVTTSNVGNTGENNIHDAIDSVRGQAVAAKTTVTEGDNIVVTESTNADGSTNYEVATAKDVKFDSVTATDADGNETILDAKGVSLKDQAGNTTILGQDGLGFADPMGNSVGPRISARGIDAGNTVITGVAPGRIATDSTDAINGSQLKGVADSVSNAIGGNTTVNPDGSINTSNIGGTGKDNINDAIGAVGKAAQAAKTTVSKADGDENVTVTSRPNDEGGTDFQVGLSKDIKVDSVTAGDTVINGDGLTIAGGPSVTKEGIDAGDNKVTGVADGTVAAGSKDAINGGQLHGVADSVRNVVGGNAKVNPDGSITTSNVGGTGKNNIDDAINSVRGAAAAAKSTVSNKDGNISVNETTKADGSKDFEVGLAKDITVDSVTAKDVNANQVNVGGAGGTTIAADGVRIAEGPSITKGGVDAGNQKVTAVADGAIAADSKDAINGSQLHQSYENVGKALGGGAGYDPSTGWTAPSYQVGGNTHNNVGDALNALNNADQALGDRIINLGDQMQQAFYDTNQRIDDVKKMANAGVAAAMALETAPYISGKYTYAVGAAYHGGENAVGLTLRKTADNGRWSLTTGVAAASQGDPSFRVGLSGVFD
ncbi:ESPR-type extended signal peptide-containing protein [Acinetobacter higginsii]|uniref:ESPR-type extended signal peptide-containing protein n=1 Tax=Acinetobacter higginsii TaxID=70347 RepID=UPI003009D374